LKYLYKDALNKVGPGGKVR